MTNALSAVSVGVIMLAALPTGDDLGIWMQWGLAGVVVAYHRVRKNQASWAIGGLKWSALILGSETQKVLTHSRLPVIVIR